MDVNADPETGLYWYTNYYYKLDDAAVAAPETAIVIQFTEPVQHILAIRIFPVLVERHTEENILCGIDVFQLPGGVFGRQIVAQPEPLELHTRKRRMYMKTRILSLTMALAVCLGLMVPAAAAFPEMDMPKTMLSPGPSLAICIGFSTTSTWPMPQSRAGRVPYTPPSRNRWSSTQEKGGCT